MKNYKVQIEGKIKKISQIQNQYGKLSNELDHYRMMSGESTNKNEDMQTG